MKRLYALLISLFLAVSFLSATNIIGFAKYVSDDQATSFVRDKILQSGLYGSIDYYVGSYSDSEWLVFVDLEPQKGWEHRCSYYYVSKQQSGSTITYRKVDARIPPSGIELTPKIITNKSTTAPLKIKVPKDNSVAADTATYAVILSGGINKYSNHERYWNDCSFIYQALINKYHLPKDNIYVVMADGTDPAPDMNCGGSFKSSPLDLDFDNSPDIKYAATKSNVTNIFNELSRKLTEENHLFFFVIDHGGTHDYNSQSYICLWNNESLEDYELSQKLDQINAGSMNIVLGQCFSGGFIDNIAKKGRVISTASTGKESSWACGNIPYDEFVYHWTSAVAGCTAYGASVVSDADKNGKVTMDEAFLFAKNNDKRAETPMYDSTPLSIGEDLAFNNLPELIDLYIKDNAADTGKEPNLTTDVGWNSPDIWVRNKKDGILEHENPYYSDDHPVAFINVRIHNRGIKNYDGRGKYLHVYWAKASTGLSKNAWRGRELYDDYVVGEALRVQRLDQPIPADKEYIATIIWSLPYELLGPESNNNTEHHHFCLFARISDSHLDTDEEGMWTKYNTADILGKKTLAQKNLSIIQKENSADLLSTVFVRNTVNSVQNYTLEVRPHALADRDLFNKAQVDMVMSEPILKAWERGGTKAMDVKYSPSIKKNTLQLKSADSKVQSIKLNSNEFEKISLQCNFNVSSMISTQKYAIDLIQRDEATGDIIGGETFIIDPSNVRIMPPVVINPGFIRADGTYQLSAESADNITNYTWTDKEGNIVGDAQKVTVAPTKANNKFTVTAKEGGALTQASITLEQMHGIKSVSPSPATNYVDIILKEPVDNDVTYIKLQSASANNEPIVRVISQNESQIRVELDKLPQGVILIQLISDNQIIDSTKIIKN